MSAATSCASVASVDDEIPRYGLTMDRPTIGILAGMGPRSTGPFVDRVVAECQLQYGARHDIDFPR
jgi:hypothetical protein